MNTRRGMVLAVILLALAFSWAPSVVHAAGPAQQATCEPWQMPDGMGGCVDRCPPEQQWVDDECRPRPCPSDRIDLNGNGEDNGDCEPMDLVDVPRPVAANCAQVGNFGTIQCRLAAPFDNLAVYGSPGCLRVDRNYFPRAIVNRQVTFRITGVIPTAQLPSAASAEGFYRPNPANWNQVWGRTLGEEAQGTPLFHVSEYLTTALGDATPYPNIDNVRGYIEVQRVGGNDWAIEGGSGTVQLGVLHGDVLRATFRQSSFPGPGTSMAMTGPNATNSANELPAYQLIVTSLWEMTYVVSYDFYAIDTSDDRNRYVLAGTVIGARIPLLTGFSAHESQRVLGGKLGGALQSTTGIDYCVSGGALDGYVPVPVIEMQSVLR